MPLLHGATRGLPAGGRLTGRWRYNGMVGHGIALSYDRGMSVSPPPRRLDVHGRGRLTGRWRYNAVAGRGIAVSYGQGAPSAPLPPPSPLPSPSPLPPPAPLGRRAGPLTHGSGVRVLCSCGDVFTFEGEAAACPTCGRRAEWPTMGVVEREMRSDLEELLNAHKQGDDAD